MSFLKIVKRSFSLFMIHKNKHITGSESPNLLIQQRINSNSISQKNKNQFNLKFSIQTELIQIEVRNTKLKVTNEIS